jgi:hypothetical protein
MYGIPENLDLADLIGDRLDSITIQEHQIAFEFDRGMSFVVEGQMDVTRNGSPVARWEQKTGWSSIEFQKVVGATVESFTIPSRDELNMLFSGNWMLRIYDNSSQYESFHVYPQDIHI